MIPRLSFNYALLTLRRDALSPAHHARARQVSVYTRYAPCLAPTSTHLHSLSSFSCAFLPADLTAPPSAQSFLQNPYYFMFASLAKPDEDVELHWLKVSVCLSCFPRCGEISPLSWYACGPIAASSLERMKPLCTRFCKPDLNNHPRPVPRATLRPSGTPNSLHSE